MRRYGRDRKKGRRVRLILALLWFGIRFLQSCLSGLRRTRARALDIASISAIVAAVGVIVGVALAYLEIRNVVRTRQMDLVMRLYSVFGNMEFQETWIRDYFLEFKDYYDFMERYVSPTNVETWASMNTLCIFFEGVGVILRRKLVDMELVGDLFATPVKLTWEKVKPLVKGLREQFDRPRIYGSFEYSSMKCRNLM